MKIIKTKFQGLIIFKKKYFKDSRGYFLELYKKKIIKKNFPFTCISYSKKNVIRGMHMQIKNTQAKYISVLKGRVLDVVVDLRKNSRTFGKYFKVILSEQNSKSIYVPEGFAHGFLCLDKENYIVYGCTKYRDAKSEISIKWNDPDLKINWGITKPILSQRDKFNKYFNKINFK